MPQLKIGSIVTLDEMEGRKFLVTKKDGGGFGIVYFLKSLSDLPDCVMKTFKNKVSFEDIEKEAFLWSQLGSNNYIANFMCFGKYEGKPYVLSERYQETFDSLIGKNLNTNLAKDLFKKVVEGIDYANKKLNLIHRDIKPSNIFLDKAIPKIGDFGLAIYEKFEFQVDERLKTYKKISDITKASFGGTYPFMAPELFSKNPIFSISTDIFAIGITFFLMYSNGLLPYDIYKHAVFTDSFEIFNNNCKDEEFRNTILKCINLNPNKRYKKYEEIPLYRENKVINIGNSITDIVNTVQVLRREGKIEQALAYTKDELIKQNLHPLLINQIAIIYRLEKKDNVFEFILSDYFESVEIKNEPYLYFDPLFTLANYYFCKDEQLKFLKLLDKFERYYKKNKKYLSLYPEYGIYMALKGYFHESYDIFRYTAENINLPPKYWIFFCCVCKILNKYKEFYDILRLKNGEFEKILIDDIKTIESFNNLVKQSRLQYKEFMNAIF